MSFFGLLNVNKPAGMTSRDVVNRVQRVTRSIEADLPKKDRTKIGHAGTLDPLATGVLVVALGPATRLIEYVQRMPKRYTGTFLLGQESPTEDVEGEVTLLDRPPEPTLDELRRAAEKLTGEIQQRPPAYSALKIKGRRAYNLARAGKEVDLQPRPITIYRLDVIDYAYPSMVLDVECGSGTYIRSLGRDLAESLGTGAVMSALERIAIGSFRVADAMSLDELSVESITARLIPPQQAVTSLPQTALSADEVQQLENGTMIQRSDLDAEEIAAVDADGRLIAILTVHGNGMYRPAKNFEANTRRENGADDP